MSTTTDIPRWATPLGEQTWERLNEMLSDGHSTPDIMSELGIPESKRRSLQVYARKYGPRRRLIRYAEFKDALLGGAAQIGQDFARALKLIAFKATSPNVDDKTQRQACEVMNEFAKTIAKMMAGDEKAEAQRQREENAATTVDPQQVVSKLLALYGVDGGSDG